MTPEIHKDPVFNGHYHQAVWVYAWTSNKTEEKPPPEAPVICAICGVVKGEKG